MRYGEPPLDPPDPIDDSVRESVDFAGEFAQQWTNDGPEDVFGPLDELPARLYQDLFAWYIVMHEDRLVENAAEELASEASLHEAERWT